MTKQEQDKEALQKGIELLHLMRRVVESGRVVELKQGRSSAVGANQVKQVTLAIEITLDVLPEDEPLVTE